MALSDELVFKLVKTLRQDKSSEGSTVRGKVVSIVNDIPQVRLDGASENDVTPIESAVEVKADDRVLVSIKNHSATIIGNTTDAAITANGNTVETINNDMTNADGALGSRITQTETDITTEVTNRQNADSSLSSRITQTANDITTEVTNRQNADSSLSSRITQTATDITTEVTNRTNADSALSSRITQTANDISAEVRNRQNADSGFSLFRQTVEGFTFMNQGGTVKLSNGDIVLTGSISFDDLNLALKTTINNAQVPSYIKSTYIDSTEIRSPTIKANTFNIYPDSTSIRSGSFNLYGNGYDQNGFLVTQNKFKIVYDENPSPTVQFIGKTGTYAYWSFNLTRMYGTITFYDSINFDGADVTFDGATVNYAGSTIDFTGSTVLGLPSNSLDAWPIGSIMWRYDQLSPAWFVGGTWTRLSPYFMYAAGSNATLGETGQVITAGGTNSALYMKVAAWRRVS